MTTGPTDAFHCSCPACGAAVDVIPETVLMPAAEHNRRVTELLAANAIEVERRRAAEAECARLSSVLDNREQENDRLRADIDCLAEDRGALAEKLRAAEADRDRWHKDRDMWCLKAMSYADDGAALSAAYEHSESAEALAERMWPIVEAVTGIKSPHDFAFTIFPTGNSGDDLIRAAAALVREREEKEPK